MSWNLSTRVNNIQTELNNLVLNGPVQNPVQANINMNNFNLNNVNIIQGTVANELLLTNQEAIRLQSLENVTLSTPNVHITGNLTVDGTLNQSLSVSAGNDGINVTKDGNDYQVSNLGVINLGAYNDGIGIHGTKDDLLISNEGVIELRGGTGISITAISGVSGGFTVTNTGAGGIPPLTSVLGVGNSAGNQNITGVNALTCNTLNYTTLNPPISSNLNLNQVLINGNNAGNEQIVGLGYLNFSNTGNLLGYNGGIGYYGGDAYGNIFDSHYVKPVYQQYYNDINTTIFTNTNDSQVDNICKLEATIPPGSVQTLNSYQMDIDYIQFQISDTVALPNALIVYLYITDTLNKPYDPNSFTSIEFIPSATNHNIFTSTLPISLKYYTTTPTSNYIYFTIYYSAPSNSGQFQFNLLNCKAMITSTCSTIGTSTPVYHVTS